MGFWGPGIWENDTALDWILTVNQRRGSKKVSVMRGLVSKDPAVRAAAAEVIAWTIGQGLYGDDDVYSVAAQFKKPSSADLRIAQNTVKKLIEQSPLEFVTGRQQRQYSQMLSDLLKRLQRRRK